jgi:ABC-type glycerol-3-phosphate transport system substrate-binding protein
MTRSRIDRRTLLQRAAVGASALAVGAHAVPSRAAVTAQDKVNLEFWTAAADPGGKDVITKLVDEYNTTAGADAGIFVNTRIKPDASNYVDYTTAMTSSGSPDVVMTYTYIPVPAWAANGFIQPLDAAAEKAGIKEGDFYPIAWDMINFGGHIWGLLQEFDFYQLWWNKAIHSGEAPKTFDELDRLAKEYTVFDNSGSLTQAGFIPWGGEAYVWNTMWGGSWYDVENRKWTIDKPENAAFLDWFLKYVDMYGGRDKSDALETSIPTEFSDIFQYGKVAFAREGEWVPSDLEALGLDLTYGITYLPTAEGVAEGTNVTVGGNPFLLPTRAKHPEEAVHFIQYMVGRKEGVLAWCEPKGNMPPLKDPTARTAVEGRWPDLKIYFDAIELDRMVPPVFSPQTALFDQLMGDAIDEVTYKKSSPADALAHVAQEIADAVQQFQQAHPDWEGE